MRTRRLPDTPIPARPPRWPRLTAQLDEPTLGLASFGAEHVRLTGDTLDQTRAAALDYFRVTVASHGRALYADVTDPEGTWTLIVDVDGTLTDATAVPRRRRRVTRRGAAAGGGAALAAAAIIASTILTLDQLDDPTRDSTQQAAEPSDDVADTPPTISNSTAPKTTSPDSPGTPSTTPPRSTTSPNKARPGRRSERRPDGDKSGGPKDRKGKAKDETKARDRGRDDKRTSDTVPSRSPKSQPQSVAPRR